MPTNTIEKSAANYLEELLQRSVVDSAFRDELLTNPESFGISADTKFVLPTAVATPEESGVDLNDDIAEELGVVAACRTTCTYGYITIMCDGVSV